MLSAHFIQSTFLSCHRSYDIASVSLAALAYTLPEKEFDINAQYYVTQITLLLACNSDKACMILFELRAIRR